MTQSLQHAHPIQVVQPIQPVQPIQIIHPVELNQSTQNNPSAEQLQQPHLVQGVRGTDSAAVNTESRSSGFSFNGMRLIEAVADDGSGRTVYIAIPYIFCL